MGPFNHRWHQFLEHKRNLANLCSMKIMSLYRSITNFVFMAILLVLLGFAMFWRGSIKGGGASFRCVAVLYIKYPFCERVSAAFDIEACSSSNDKTTTNQHSL